jgi:hypothetical protein
MPASGTQIEGVEHQLALVAASVKATCRAPPDWDVLYFNVQVAAGGQSPRRWGLQKKIKMAAAAT